MMVYPTGGRSSSTIWSLRTSLSSVPSSLVSRPHPTQRLVSSTSSLHRNRFVLSCKTITHSSFVTSSLLWNTLSSDWFSSKALLISAWFYCLACPTHHMCHCDSYVWLMGHVMVSSFLSCRRSSNELDCWRESLLWFWPERRISMLLNIRRSLVCVCQSHAVVQTLQLHV